MNDPIYMETTCVNCHDPAGYWGNRVLGLEQRIKKLRAALEWYPKWIGPASDALSEDDRDANRS